MASDPKGKSTAAAKTTEAKPLQKTSATSPAPAALKPAAPAPAPALPATPVAAEPTPAPEPRPARPRDFAAIAREIVEASGGKLYGDVLDIDALAAEHAA